MRKIITIFMLGLVLSGCSDKKDLERDKKIYEIQKRIINTEKKLSKSDYELKSIEAKEELIDLMYEDKK